MWDSFVAILRKEFTHILRDRGTLMVAMTIPLFQLMLFGFIDQTVQNLPTVVVDQDQSADSRELMQELFLTVSRNIERWAPTSGQGSFRAWLRRVTRNLLINWLKPRGRCANAAGGSDLQFLLNQLPAAGPEGSDFDYELRRALFRRASDVVRPEIAPQMWTAFWETGVLGASAAAFSQASITCTSG